MPYITKERRAELDDAYHDAFADNPGELAYVLYREILDYLPPNYRFYNINEVLGVLSAVESEFKRKILIPYEKDALIKNGGIE